MSGAPQKRGGLAELGGVAPVLTERAGRVLPRGEQEEVAVGGGGFEVPEAE